MHITPITLLIASVLATPAFAQDNPADFSGVRVEGILGWDQTEILGEDDGGLLYGVGAGYDVQSGRAVFGIEGEAIESSNKGCVGSLAADVTCVRSGRDLYVGGRAGVLVGRAVLLYGRIGYTNARYVTTTSGLAGGGRFGVNLDGIRIGAGAEFSLSRNLYLRAEARYSNYEGGSDRGGLSGAFGIRF